MTGPRPTTLLKLGGSLITDKTRPEHVRDDHLRRLAREIAREHARMPGKLIVGHGAGSFGHVAARRHRIGDGSWDDRKRLGAATTQDRAAVLHRFVIQALIAAKAPAFSLPPSSYIVSDNGRPSKVAMEGLLGALESGLLPVVYGDVVTDTRLGASICSTEQVFLSLVLRLKRRGYPVERALWAGETGGIYDASGETIPRVDRSNLARIRLAVTGSRGTDVTGGMRLRLETTAGLARRGIASWIGDGRVRGRIGKALRGDPVPGTHVVP